MRTVLDAKVVTAYIDENIDVLIIGFADDEYEPQSYLLLQYSLALEESDIELGFDKAHLTLNDESKSIYGGVATLQLNNNHIEIALHDKAIHTLNCNPVIDIYFDEAGVDLEELHHFFLQMFANEQGVYSLNIR